MQQSYHYKGRVCETTGVQHNRQLPQRKGVVMLHNVGEFQNILKLATGKFDVQLELEA